MARYGELAELSDFGLGSEVSGLMPPSAADIRTRNQVADVMVGLLTVDGLDADGQLRDRDEDPNLALATELARRLVKAVGGVAALGLDEGRNA